VFGNLRAIAPTSACASAVANIARASPRGWRRARIAPTHPMASTPTYSRLAGSSSSIPMRPAAALSQMIRLQPSAQGRLPIGTRCCSASASFPCRYLGAPESAAKTSAPIVVALWVSSSRAACRIAARPPLAATESRDG
jgi:hypothetical protein